MPFPVYDSQDAIPEPFRAEYEERDGKWHAKVPDVSGAQSALEKERQKARDEEKARKAAEKERDELKRARDAQEKGITEEQLQKLRDEEAKARKPIEEERDRLAAENRKLKLTDRARALALKSGVMPDRIDKAMKDLEGRLDLAEGGETIVVKDAKGVITTESIEDFLTKTYKAEAPFFYAGSGASGSGSDGSSGGSGGTGYDPVAAGKAAAKEQAAGREQNALAFR